MTVPLVDFTDLLLPELPDCSEPLIALHLRECAREFCRLTSVWRADLVAVDLVGGTSRYLIPQLDADSEVTRITRMSISGTLVWEESDRDPKSGVAPTYERNMPPFAMSPDLLSLTLIEDETPSASVAGGLVLAACLWPSVTATVLPNLLKTQYSEALRMGTLVRLMKMGGRPWTNYPLSVDYQRDWHKLVNVAAYQGQVGNTREKLRTKKWG